MRKFEVSAAPGVSPASTSTGVRAFAASASPVTAFVSPGPWCTEHTPTRPVTRAQPSAMHTRAGLVAGGEEPRAAAAAAPR